MTQREELVSIVRRLPSAPVLREIRLEMASLLEKAKNYGDGTVSSSLWWALQDIEEGISRLIQRKDRIARLHSTESLAALHLGHPVHPDLHPDDDGDTRGIVLANDPEA